MLNVIMGMVGFYVVGMLWVVGEGVIDVLVELMVEYLLYNDDLCVGVMCFM